RSARPCFPGKAETTKPPGPGGFVAKGDWAFPGSSLGGFHGDHAHVALVVALAAEFHDAVHQCVQGVVHADAHVLAGVVLGAALTHDDVAGHGMAAAENLHAEALRVRLPVVLGTA